MQLNVGILWEGINACLGIGGDLPTVQAEKKHVAAGLETESLEQQWQM